MRTRSCLLALLSLQCWRLAHGGDSAAGKAIAVYEDRSQTRVVIQSREPLISGRQVFAGERRIPLTVHEQLSRAELLYYYNSTAPGKAEVKVGDEIHTVGPSTGVLTMRIQEHYTFEQKRHGEVTSVQGDHAMIDRGSLHELRERDIYKVYDSSGRYKAMLELRGVGDLQSSGKLYNALEDISRRAPSVARGDRVVFVGQRKLFGLGFEGGVKATRSQIGHIFEENYGGGLLWNVTFPDGWGAEVLFGAYARVGKVRQSAAFDPVVQKLERRALFITPVWAKKSFFYPSPVSPFLAAGVSLFVGSNHRIYDNASTGAKIDEEAKKSTVVPMLGAGFEFFPGRFFRPRLDVRYFKGPTLRARDNAYRTESVFYSAGFATTW